MIVWTFSDIVICTVFCALICIGLCFIAYAIVEHIIHKLFYKNCRSCKHCKLANVAGWKDSINLGRANNQNFVSIPYNMLVQMLEYKCKLAGINFVIVNEAYTSKCSFLDREKIAKHDIYAGRRVKRGFFISSSGIMINADVNGSLNIMRLGLEKKNVKLDVVEEILRPENKRFVLNPVRICA